jgi:hypothetical protein
MQVTQKQQPWNVMNCGHLSCKNLIECGFGLLSAERHDKLLHKLLETEMRRLVMNCGMQFMKVIALDVVLPISGMHIKQSSHQEQHSAVGKETGGTAHIKRWNNTLR